MSEYECYVKSTRLPDDAHAPSTTSHPGNADYALAGAAGCTRGQRMRRTLRPAIRSTSQAASAGVPRAP